MQTVETGKMGTRRLPEIQPWSEKAASTNISSVTLISFHRWFLLTLLGTTGPLCILTDSASRNICGLDSIKQLLAETSKKISSSLTLSLTQVHSPSLVGHMKDLGRLIGQKEKAVAAPWNGSHISNINCHPWDPLVLMSCWHSGLTVSWSLPS